MSRVATRAPIRRGRGIAAAGDLPAACPRDRSKERALRGADRLIRYQSEDDLRRDRLDDVKVEARREGALAVCRLPPSGARDQQRTMTPARVADFARQLV